MAPLCRVAALRFKLEAQASEGGCLTALLAGSAKPGRSSENYPRDRDRLEHHRPASPADIALVCPYCFKVALRFPLFKMSRY